VEILPCTPIIKSITLTKFIIPLRKMFIPIQQLHLAQQAMPGKILEVTPRENGFRRPP
jgi:hypothetical protein